MAGISAAQKQACSFCARDPIFTPAFFRPYEAAAHSALLLIAGARHALSACERGGEVLSVTYRLKTPQSIREKLHRKGLPPSAEAAGAALHDVVGLRVVLSSVPAIYDFAALLTQAPCTECIGIHDYIAAPKKSGYRSLHVLLRVPVMLSRESLMMPAEIQLRTAPMDLWAAAEHSVCYKPLTGAAREFIR